MGRTRTTGKVEPVNKIWLSAREACAYLDCSLDFLETLRNKTPVKITRVGRMIWYDLASLNLFLDKNRVN